MHTERFTDTLQVLANAFDIRIGYDERAAEMAVSILHLDQGLGTLTLRASQLASSDGTLEVRTLMLRRVR